MDNVNNKLQKGVTILIPCLNEVKTLGVCINKAKTFLKNSNYDGEVLIADNGSTDGSVELAKELEVHVVHIEEKGYGAALRGVLKQLPMNISLWEMQMIAMIFLIYKDLLIN